MEPLPLKTRRVYAFVSFAVFATLLSLAALYASGYRLDGFALVKTGGIYISIPISDAEVALNGEKVGKSGFLSKSFFIDDLAPGPYIVSVEADGYYAWSKRLTVEQQVVSDTNAFLVPKGLLALEILGTTTRSVATTTRAVTNEEYADLLALFEPTLDDILISTSTPDDLDGGMELYVKDGDVYVEWVKSLTAIPSVFCFSPSSCVSRVQVEKERENVEYAKFFRGGVVYQTKDAGIYLTEIDVKAPQKVVPLYSKNGAAFRVYKNEIIVLDGKSLFVIEGF